MSRPATEELSNCHCALDGQQLSVGPYVRVNGENARLLMPRTHLHTPLTVSLRLPLGMEAARGRVHAENAMVASSPQEIMLTATIRRRMSQSGKMLRRDQDEEIDLPSKILDVKSFSASRLAISLDRLSRTRSEAVDLQV